MVPYQLCLLFPGINMATTLTNWEKKRKNDKLQDSFPFCYYSPCKYIWGGEDLYKLFFIIIALNVFRLILRAAHVYIPTFSIIPHVNQKQGYVFTYTVIHLSFWFFRTYQKFILQVWSSSKVHNAGYCIPFLPFPSPMGGAKAACSTVFTGYFSAYL